MAHVVQVALAWEPSDSSPDLNEYVLFLDILDSKHNNNENKKLQFWPLTSKIKLPSKQMQ